MKRVSSDPELVIGVVTPVGTDTATLVSDIRGELAKWNYNVDIIKVSELLPSSQPGSYEHEDNRIRRLIDVGNEYCHAAQRHDAVAALAVSEIRIKRALANGATLDDEDDVKTRAEQPANRQAYIIHSLKRPGEVELLRAVYGNYFYLIGSQASLEKRIETLAARLHTHTGWDEETKKKRAKEIIDWDASETHEYGQGVNKTFPSASYFIPEGESPQRAISLLFGDHRIQPGSGEHAMFMAHATSSRSLVGSRRVGASIVDSSGILISVGTNEVPGTERPDAELQHDVSEHEKRALLADTINRLDELAGLSDDFKQKRDQDIEQLLDHTMEGLSGSKLLDVIEFQRPVHAEMDAITVAARSGKAVDRSRMYTTTYPCHLCAKHVIAVGISELYYIEPYPKSKAESMYASTAATIRPYCGVNPKSYASLFLDRELPTPDARGRIPPPATETTRPLVPDDDYGRVIEAESDALAILPDG